MGWKCGNCGHVTDKQTDHLEELSFKWFGDLTSQVSCPNCGSYTLQRAWNENFTAGEFLVVTTKNRIRGKVNAGTVFAKSQC